MKSSKITRPIIILLFAVVLSVGVFMSRSLDNVPPCVNSPECNSTTVGTLKTVKHGFPATYKETVEFMPSNSNNYAVASIEPENPNIALVFVNIIFWYALLDSIYRMFASKAQSRPAAKPSKTK